MDMAKDDEATRQCLHPAPRNDYHDDAFRLCNQMYQYLHQLLQHQFFNLRLYSPRESHAAFKQIG